MSERRIEQHDVTRRVIRSPLQEGAITIVAEPASVQPTSASSSSSARTSLTNSIATAPGSYRVGDRPYASPSSLSDAELAAAVLGSWESRRLSGCTGEPASPEARLPTTHLPSDIFSQLSPLSSQRDARLWRQELALQHSLEQEILEAMCTPSDDTEDDSMRMAVSDALDPYRELRAGGPRCPLMQSSYSMCEVSLEDSFVLVDSTIDDENDDEEEE